MVPQGQRGGSGFDGPTNVSTGVRERVEAVDGPAAGARARDTRAQRL